MMAGAPIVPPYMNMPAINDSSWLNIFILKQHIIGSIIFSIYSQAVIPILFDDVVLSSNQACIL